MGLELRVASFKFRAYGQAGFVDEVLLALTDVCERHIVDKSRVYITGLSMGAFGAWSLAASQPHMIAQRPSAEV